MLTARGLYDPCLSLRTAQRVVGNDLRADGRALLVVTGANQGGKSTFMRSLGLAQLMLQCGMFAPARELSGDAVPGTAYLLDEPTHGLHAADVARLNSVLRRLVERGGTVGAVTHHPAVMAAADWLVELGEEGGSGGGKVVAQDVPAAVARQDTHTGRVLARWA